MSSKSTLKELKIFMVFVVVVLTILVSAVVTTKNNRIEPEIGCLYLHSFNWDEKDPFYGVRIDTVRVLDIEGGYILYEDVNESFYNKNSTTIDRFTNSVKKFK